jgi:4-amino-4-deoxy-L-arabinose transferase-like glycosyltransferase
MTRVAFRVPTRLASQVRHRFQPTGAFAVAFRALTSSPVLFIIALVVRLVAIHSSPIFRPDPRDHLDFGAEVGRIARALVEGHGYADPFLGRSGPTAWIGPVYPLIVAAMFKIFGIYSSAAGIAVLAFNSLCAALTCLTIRRLARFTFGDTVGLIAAWMFALLPFDIAWASRWVWDTSLSTLLLCLVLLLTLRLVARDTLHDWLAFGVLWGVIILTNGSLLSLLPVSLGWLLLKNTEGAVLRRLAIAMSLAALIAIPWWVRNWNTFHKFIPLRSNFGMELYLGNHAGANGVIMFWDHPMWNDDEMERYRRQGEIAYIAEKGAIARDWIRAHPADFVRISLKRVLMFWSSPPDPQRAGRASSIDTQHAILFATSVFAWVGALWGLRRRVPGTELFVATLLVYPLVYYITHTHLRYRAPLEPVMMICGVAFVVAACRASTLTEFPQRPTHRARAVRE